MCVCMCLRTNQRKTIINFLFKHTAAVSVACLSIDGVLGLQSIVEVRGGGVDQGQSSLLGGANDHCTTLHHRWGALKTNKKSLILK